jgi:hypothetical protein
MEEEGVVMALLSQDRYYAEAKAALVYTRSKMSMAEDDKFSNMLIKLAMPKFFVNEVYVQEDKLMKAMGVPEPNAAPGNWDTYGLQYIEAMSLAAQNMGAGNCGEQAAIAFMYLYHQKVRPIDYMQAYPRNAFVVVGASVRPTRHNFKEWATGAAMLCDPWALKVYSACNVALMYAPTTMFSLFRVE